MKEEDEAGSEKDFDMTTSPPFPANRRKTECDEEEEEEEDSEEDDWEEVEGKHDSESIWSVQRKMRNRSVELIDCDCVCTELSGPLGPAEPTLPPQAVEIEIETPEVRKQ